MDFSKLSKSKEEEIKVYNQKVEKMSQTPDPDTKILFQYPKGQFKFPLIPDREQNKRKPRERNREDNEPKQGKNVTKETTRRAVRDPEPKRRSFDGEETSKIVPSKTPFRPTEIPSPIYGFRRPEKKIVPSEEIVEYELESKLPILKKEEPDIEIPVSIPEITKEVSNAEMTIEPSVLIPEQAEKKREDSEIPAFFRRNPIESLPEEAVSEPAVEKEAIEQDQVDFGREVAVSIMERADDTSPEAISDPGEVAVQSNQPPVSQGILPESDPSEAIPEVQPKRPKKHIPFNVMMLKQDREKNAFMNKMMPEKKSLNSERAVVSPDKRPMNDAAETEAGQAKPSAIPERKPEEGRVMPKEETPAITPTFLDTKVSSETAAVPENTVESNNGSNPKPPLEQESPISGNGYQEAVYTEAAAESGQGDTPAVFGSVEADDNPYYVFPNIELLTPPTYAVHDDEWLEEQTLLLDETLKNFNVRAKVVNVTQGPAVTRFEVHPEPGVKVNKVTNLMDDIKLSLAAQDMRMEAPIPGKHTIGIEIPNRKSKPVFLREVLESTEFQEHESPLAVALGLDISGQPIITDLRKMPHGLIAGQTGSGKSVCINTMLVSLLYKATPQELKLLLIDPKMVELAPYNRIPHLVSPVITDVKAATAALKWAVEEMERRYELFVHAGVRDITRFNDQAEKAGQYSSKLPYILVIIDELADLMMMSPADVEEAICRIAQKARACGIHLIVATQRPSVDVITGLIKANIPTRIAFSVSSQVDSRTIIDSGGAEKLLGRGDMLFAENGSSKTVRLQGTFVSDEEIDQVVNHVKLEQQPKYLFEQEDLLNRAQVTEEADELFFEACEFVVSQQAASASSVQRRFRVGYNRASRLIEMMEQQGVVSESRGSRPRDVLITEEELEFLHVN
ncbi:DNA translocase FtsK [Peribacillus simplex]|uniref:DNA translocase FtsK n=3 Tax=Bacillaceae TaxID=186817 RepID=A0AA90P6V4_9BACI|nr:MULTISPECIES: DNA translocase FtsK [Peribacillus]MDP1417184.1 DNA translocase FtsK [Peribacillus simplex]MDP1449839.1 DNA translocase FtsK [Peribacillus frigoritolerans]